LKREETIAVLRELISLDLVNPFLVSLHDTKGNFSLRFNGDCDLPQLRQFIRKRNLLMHEEKDYYEVFSS